MTDALTADQRSKLGRPIGRGRALLEDDLAGQAAGRFGIDPDGTIASEETLRLDPGGLATRREIVEVVEHLRSEGDSAPDAVARLLREAVFTHVNRLVAIRIAEALDLLPESLARGNRSQGYQHIRELAPLLNTDDTNGYWTYLQLCGDELAGDVPNLFDPRNPLLALAPSPVAVGHLVKLFADPSNADLWAASDCLGWTYQFFNTSEERQEMRKASPAPRNSRELAVRNQFFTPRYVVDFLVQNSLGRRLLEADPTSPLFDDLPLLVDPPTEQGQPTELQDVAVLDPACGSGHFLLAAYDLLERAWQHSGVEASDAAPYIVRSLWGIDIDPRCTQVASAAILFRARLSRPNGSLPRPNIVCARSLPTTATGLDEILERLEPNQRALIEVLTEALQDAPVLGPLLRIEERIEDEIRLAIAGTAKGGLSEAIEPTLIEDMQNDLLTSLRALADATTATPAERLLAAEADDAVRFVMALLRRYDAVLQNPPFGEPVPSTKPYLKANYPWIPTKDYNLLAAFVGRGLDLCRPGVGYQGAITSRAGMFLKTFEAWRTKVFLGNHLVALADLGEGVMEQALVEAAAYVLRTEPARPEQRATFVRLLKDTDRASGLASAIDAHRNGKTDSRIFETSLDALDAIPGSPVAYWISPGIQQIFKAHPSVEGTAGDARQGLATGHDFRYVRAFWEVAQSSIARSRAETESGKRWVPFAKGGEYSPYWSDIHLVVDYGNDGDELREYVGSVIRSPQYYFRPGLTWPPRTNSGFGIRVLPSGTIFGHKGPTLIPANDPYAVLGWLTSRLIQACIDAMVAAGGEVRSGGASRSYEVGLVQKLPWIRPIGRDAEISSLVSQVTDLRRRADLNNETTRMFTTPGVMPHVIDGSSLSEAAERVAATDGTRYVEILRLTHRLETRIHELAELDSESEAYLDAEVGPHPASYDRGPLVDAKLYRLLQDPIDKVVKELIKERGGSRAIANLTFFADRRLEVLAHGLQRPPSQIESFRRDNGILPSDEPTASARAVVSYLVGTSVGRWDIRAAGVKKTPLSDAFDPVPLYPPGMLLDDGSPARSTPPGYDLDIPPGQLLYDQPGHPWDIVERVLTAAGLFVDDAELLHTDVVIHLKGQDLRDHLRKHFFKDHLRRYTKSRRNAPIYWPLYVPSGSWGVWAYAPSLSRETLYAVEAAATARLNAAEIEISRLRRDQQDGGGGRSPQQVAAALDAEQRLAEELRVFRNEAERMARLGWVPDLDDGIVLCAAPLADLFPAWKEARKERTNIKAGKYPWASVTKWADEL